MQYLYYKLFQLIKPMKSNKSPELTAVLFIVFLEYINITTLKLLIVGNNEFEFMGNINSVRAFAVIIGAIVFTFNYIYLLKRHKSICAQYKNENKAKYRLGFLYLSLYVLFTFIALFIEVRINHLY